MLCATGKTAIKAADVRTEATRLGGQTNDKLDDPCGRRRRAFPDQPWRRLCGTGAGFDRKGRHHDGLERFCRRHEVDGTSFNLVTDGEWAWTAGPDDDVKVLAALKKGASAILTGHSAKGTQTKDTFSLRGFTAAMDEAGKQCQ